MKRAIVAAVMSVLVVAQVASAQTGATSTTGPFSISAEALMWWFKGNATPPVVSDGPLDEPGTKALLGGDRVDTNPNAGFRVNAGYSLTERWGVEGSVFYIPPRSTRRSVGSSGQVGSPELFVPFIDAVIPEESVTELSSPGFFAGRATEKLRNSLLGAELNATMRVGSPWRLDVLGGFRYLRLSETYSFSTDSPNISPQPLDVFQTKDRFDVTNSFYGAQLGVRGAIDRGPWFASGVVKVALGAMVQSVDIDGRLITNDFNDFGAPQTFAGGYFAQPTNMGSHTRKVFAVVPEAGLTLGYRLTPWLSVVAGYTFLYASNVVRAPEQVNRAITPSAVPAITGNPPSPLTGPAEPSFKFKSSDFWAQGLNLGLAFRF